MDIQRGRSPSQGANIRHSHSPSPSPHPPFVPNISGHSLQHSLSPPPDPAFNNPTTNTVNTSPPYDLAQQQYQPQSYPQQTSIADHTFLQAGAPDRSASPSFTQQGNLFALGGASENTGFEASTIDPSFLNAPGNNDPTFLDPQLLDPSFGDQPLINDMAATQAHSPTPPHLLQPDMHRTHSPSPHHSPNMNQGAFVSPAHSPHSRNISLDPSSAAYGQGQANEWAGMNFRGHRRAPSDAYSDVSSHPSPYLNNADDFDANGNPSPLLGAQQDPALYPDVMTFGQFSLNEANGSRHVSPAHSPHISPRLLPQQQSLPPFTAENNFGLVAPMNPQYANHGLGVYAQSQEAFPTLQQSSVDFGQADHMSPPEINIDFAPPSRQPSFEPPQPGDADNALSPPDRSRSRNRMRAKSDSSLATPSRASTPATGEFDPNSLSPNAAKSSSRSPSPSAKSSRRSSTSSIPHRDYILDLADPSRPGSAASVGPGDANNGSKRTQKHPATFQCTLCPKRFTRAYNLRSHLRTHTDERPFVCTVCGKAFARQHDRKRHEGLHSGEKKFVCRGVLKDSNTWGCGRRFARADALGRHFRSEAGRVCIRPLLEEEAQEKGWESQQHVMNNGNGMMPPHMQAQMPGMMHPGAGYDAYGNVPGEGMAPPGGMGAPQYALPAALLQQYPALAGIQWDTLPPGPPDEMEGDISGRSSFDASSGGEYYEEDDDFTHQGQPQPQQQYGYV